jgi:16S rRNA (guanine527-N7)-methyltransferase
MGEAEARAFCAERVDAEGIERLEQLTVLLAEENQSQNLVSTSSLEMVWLRHFADSLQLLDDVPRETGVLIDLGSGAGLPGLPLAIARPDMEVILVESRKRRAEWLARAATKLGLHRCRVEGARLEAVQSFPADVITARAFAPLDRLLPLASRFSTPDTVWLLPKGRSAAQELASQPISVQKMFHVKQSATDASGGILIGKGAPPVR